MDSGAGSTTLRGSRFKIVVTDTPPRATAGVRVTAPLRVLDIRESLLRVWGVRYKRFGFRI